MGGWRRLLAGWGAVLMLGACSTGSTAVDRRDAVPSGQAGGQSGLWPQPANPLTGEAASSWWTDSVPAELAPTGLDVVVRPGAQALVVDGSGGAWLHGPWHLVRVDPRTGAAETWDVGDDPLFGDVLGIRSSTHSGVWLILPDRIRLFDGERFVRDIPIPMDFLGGPEGEVTDLVEVGAEVWIASQAGVARWTGAGWGLVRREFTRVRALAVDSAGAVWAAGRFSGGDRSRSAVVRFGAGGWAEPTAEGAPRIADQLVAHPNGGIVALYGSDVRWFDGTSWQAFPLAGMGLGIGTLRMRALAMTEDGAAWLLGDEGLARGTPEGWAPLPTPADFSPVGVATAGADVLVAEGSSLHRVDGATLKEVWSQEPQGPVASQAAIGDPDWWWGDPPWAVGDQLSVGQGDLAVVSARELWAQSEGYPFSVHYVGGAWQEVPLTSVWRAPVVATDGAVWLGTTKGLVRFAGTTQTRITTLPVMEEGGPGWDGSVLVLPSQWYGWWYADGYVDGPPEYLDIQQIDPDGSITSIPLPVGRWSLTSTAAGPEGRIWATACADGEIDPCPTPSELLRWDAEGGAWTPVPYPGFNVTLIGVAGDGSLWARITPRAEGVEADGTAGAAAGLAVVARYDDGRWTTVLDEGVPDELVMAPGDAVCGMAPASADLLCVDASGRATTWPVGVPGELSIGLDGSAWLASGARPWGEIDGAGGGMIARLPFNVRG